MEHWVFLYLVFSRWCIHIILISSLLLHAISFVMKYYDDLLLLLLLYLLWVNHHIYAWKFCVFISLIFRLFFALGRFHFMQAISPHNQANYGEIYINILWWFGKSYRFNSFASIILFWNILFHYTCKGGTCLHRNLVPLMWPYLCVTSHTYLITLNHILPYYYIFLRMYFYFHRDGFNILTRDQMVDITLDIK